MSWDSIPDKDRDRLLRLYEQRSLSLSHVSEYGYTKLESIKRRLREWRKNRLSQSLSIMKRTEFRPGKDTTYDKFFRVESDNFIVTSDWEWPDTDPDMLRLCLVTAMAHGIKDLIIAGDLISGDTAAFTTWAETYYDGDGLFDDEFAGLSMILKELAMWFDRIFIFSGNHDERVAKVTQGQLTIGSFLRYANPEVSFSIYRKMYVQTKRLTYKITHPRNYSRMPVRLGQQLSNIDPGPDGDGTRVGVVLAHTHHGQTGFTEDGTREVHSLGIMRDPKRTKYKSISDGNNPEWQQGFLMVRNSYFHPLWKSHSDWDFYLGDYAKLLKTKKPSTEGS